MIKQPMLYGSSVWSNCSRDNIMRVFKLQNRAAREADTRSKSVKLFKKLACLRSCDEVKLNKSTLVFKRLHEAILLICKISTQI